MKFKTLLTTKLLESKLSAEEINLLPSSYQTLGNICVIKLPKELRKHNDLIGKKILENFWQFKSVYAIERVTGEFRQPRIELIAGIAQKEIIVRENNCLFYLNPEIIMYSQGNHQEKKRMMQLVGDKPQLIVDMFAGIGYFTAPIAKQNPNCSIVAIEKNPEAFAYLEKNIRANYLQNITPLLGDCKKVLQNKNISKADRILMGLIPSCKKFIPAAMKISRKGTVLHYHGLVREGKEYVLLNDFGDYKVKLLNTNIVKSYKPHVNHVVLDLEVL